MKLAVVGGGSTYTPELVDGLARLGDVLPVEELVLLDPDAERLDVVGGFAQRILSERGATTRLTLTSDRDAAIDSASAVLLQLRVGGGALIKQGAGTLTLSNANTYTGLTTVSNGTLKITQSNALAAASQLLVIDTGTVELANTSLNTLTSLTLQGGSSGLATLTGTGSAAKYDGIVTLRGHGRVGAANSGDTLTLSNSINGLSDGVWDPIITKIGDGLVVLGQSAPWGGVVVSAGTLKLGTDGTFAELTLATGATLDLNNTSQNVNLLSGSGRISFGSDADPDTGKLAVGQGGFGGEISGTGSLIKSGGSASLFLSGSSLYSGTTNINGGKLSVSNPGALGSSAVTVASGATLEIDTGVVGRRWV